jgi:hypothetical protein
MALFKTKELILEKQQQKGILPVIAQVKTNLAYQKAEKEIAEYVGDLQDGQTIRYVTKGQWSMHELIRYCCLQLQEPCDIYLTTWTVTNTPIEALFQLKKEGYIKELHCLFDYRIKDTKPEAFQLISSFANSINLTKVHAKVSVILGKERGFSIISSANMSKNPRIEAGVIFCDFATAQQDKEWIIKEIQQCSQKNNSKRLKISQQLALPEPKL